MERNPNDSLGSQTPGSTGGSTGGAGMSGAGGYGAGTGATGGAGYGTTSGTAGTGGSQGAQEQDLKNRAREKFDSAREKAQSGMAQAREKAGEWKNTLADKLDAGADRLRQRGGAQYAGATPGADGSTAIGESKVDKMSGGLASGMHNTAEWLRENDLDTMKQGIEQQVREHPGRTLLIALGLGYVIGKAFRR